MILLGIVGAAAVVLTVVIDGAFDEANRTRVEAQRLADELQVANTELEERVRSRTTELADALQREQRLSAQLAELSVRDSLTGLHNRRHMDETIDRMFRYAVRSGHPLSVAIIDLDDFKRINDRYTHLVGDQVLRQAAAVLAGSVRGSDELVRMGGEEFALLMPGTSAEEAVTVCDRMRRSLAEHDWDVRHRRHRRHRQLRHSDHRDSARGVPAACAVPTSSCSRPSAPARTGSCARLPTSPDSPRPLTDS